MHGIFISYRREDTSGEAGRLAEELGSRFGPATVFIDIDAIAPGEDFEASIRRALASCRLALVLIGDRWLQASLPDGRRRIDAPDDYVRQEVTAALARAGTTVVPVLVEGAPMPAASELPDDIAGLTKRNAVELSNKRWRYDVGRICEIAERDDTWPRRLRRRMPRWARRAAPALALVALAIGIIVATTGGGGGADPAEKLAACERAHGLAASQVTRRPRSGESRIELSRLPRGSTQTAFASCSWPPAPGADADGYRSIVVTQTIGPGESAASGRDLADRIESGCQTLELQYTNAFMGEQSPAPAFRANVGDIWAPGLQRDGFSRIGRVGTSAGNQARLPFYPGRNEVVVLFSEHYKPLDAARCVA